MPIAVVAGGSGFIGRALVAALREEGYVVRAIGRRGPDARWGNAAGIRQAIDGAELLINLAGKSINCRYSETNRREILRSRLEATGELARAVAECSTPPVLWINSSTATIYRHDLPARRRSADHGGRDRLRILGRGRRGVGTRVFHARAAGDTTCRAAGGDRAR